MKRGLRAALAAFCLLGFLAQAGDGVMAALCPPGMDGMEQSTELPPPADPPLHAGVAADHGDGHDHGSDEDACPFGLASLAVCGGAATAVSPSGPALLAPEAGAALPPRLDRVPADLLSSGLFRPPRA